MTGPFDELAGLNRLIHEPARLAITAALSSCQQADFLYLQRLTGLTKGNLSAHLARLEEGGLVKITKAYEGKRPVTWVELTPEGSDATEEYWRRLTKARREARRWRPAGDQH